MSYTLRGRLESRLAAALIPLVLAAVLAAVYREWWPVEVVGLMLGVGLAFDLVYDRLLDYQPGWAAVPLGLLELTATMVLVSAIGIPAPRSAAIGLFVLAWFIAQVLGHAGYPLLRLSYGDDGGELGRAGPVAAAAVLVLFAGVGAVYKATRPPVFHLSAGVHQGPLILDRRQTLIGEPGAVVRGGIVVRANDVQIRSVRVVGGQNGIEVDDAKDVVLDRVSVSGAELDGIHVRRSQVTIKRCRIDSGENPWAQAIDISFTYDLKPSMVKDCTITGGREGIVTHSAQIDLKDNHVRGTALRGIDVTEMSMGMVFGNHVEDALGVGIFCGDRSMCHIERNTVTRTRADPASQDLTRMGYAIQAHFQAEATVHNNRLAGNPHGVAAFAGATLDRD